MGVGGAVWGKWWKGEWEDVINIHERAPIRVVEGGGPHGWVHVGGL